MLAEIDCAMRLTNDIGRRQRRAIARILKYAMREKTYSLDDARKHAEAIRDSGLPFDDGFLFRNNRGRFYA